MQLVPASLCVLFEQTKRDATTHQAEAEAAQKIINTWIEKTMELEVMLREIQDQQEAHQAKMRIVADKEKNAKMAMNAAEREALHTEKEYLGRLGTALDELKVFVKGVLLNAVDAIDITQQVGLHCVNKAALA